MPDFQRIITLHNKLAKRLKQFEGVDGQIPLPVLNEYRYACRALIEALEYQNKAQNDEFKHAEAKAYHALLNAYHDLVDGLNMSLTDRLDSFASKYLSETIQILGDKRIEVVILCNEVNEKIAESREQSKLRIEIYEKDIYDKYFDKLLDNYKYFKVATQDIFTLANKNKKDKDIAYFIGGMGIIIGVIGIIVGIIIST